MLLAGYPVDAQPERTMWCHELAIRPNAGWRVTYSASTSRGDSGAPVFVKDSADNSGAAGPVVAIHTDVSFGTRVTEDMIRNVEGWTR
jgi:V8-like Glu-specific endopeptidase